MVAETLQQGAQSAEQSAAVDNVMNLNFEWKSELPTRPSAEQVQESVENALNHFHDPRRLRSSVVAIYLKQNNIKTKVEGVGYSKEEKPIVTFQYSLFDPKFCWCNYYENPL